MPARNYQRIQAALVGHQMLDRLGAVHGKVAPQRCVLRLGPAAPERVVEAVAVQDYAERQRHVVRLRFAQMPQQLGPAIGQGECSRIRLSGRQLHDVLSKGAS